MKHNYTYTFDAHAQLRFRRWSGVSQRGTKGGRRRWMWRLPSWRMNCVRGRRKRLLTWSLRYVS